MTRAFLAVRHLDSARWGAAVALSWLAVLLFNRAALPLMFPTQDPRTFLTSGTVVGIALPLALMSITLFEGPPELTETAGRRLWPMRMTACVGYLTASAAGSAAAAAALGFPLELFVADALLLTALNVLGTGLLGVSRGWAMGVSVVLVASIPGIVPWEANWIYRLDRAGSVALLSVALAVVACIVFARFGPFGMLTRRSTLGTPGEPGDPSL